jgi:hypothetical protein
MWILAPAFLAIYIAFTASPAAPAEYTRSERCHELIHIGSSVEPSSSGAAEWPKAEPCKLRCVTIQMVGPAKYQGNGLARLLAVRLCIALMGCSALGFELPQPTQSSNTVIGAYKPPPFGVVAYGPPSGLPSLPDVTIPKPIAMVNSLA